MGRFGLGRTSSAHPSKHQGHVALYKRLCPLRLRLNDGLVSRLPNSALHEGARKLGLLRRNVLVFDSEDEMSVLMDYNIYNLWRDGRNAVDEYLCDCPPDPDSDEMLLLRAMQHATYAMVAVVDVVPGVGCHVRNLFTDETHLLVDISLAKTAMRGAVMATRLLDLGEFIVTSGAAIPLGILDDDQLEDWERRLRAGIDLDNLDPATLIRECLRRGASSDGLSAAPRIRRNLSDGILSSWGENRSQQKGQRATREARKPVANRRCRCGSGKMFKNCCGKC